MNYISLGREILYKFPILQTNTICFESNPDLTDNTYSVFNELIRRGVNNRYRFVWILNEAETDINKYPKINNVSYIPLKNINGTFNVKALFTLATSKVILSSHLIFSKFNKKQKYFYLAHGTAMKKTTEHYFFPKNSLDANVLTLSEYIADFDQINLKCRRDKMLSFGFPRNDDLFDKSTDIRQFFQNTDFDKVIYWMPTYRQHKSVCANHSNISMPILHNNESAEIINQTAKANRVLIIVKPHPAQDISLIKQYNYSHLKFIDKSFFDENHVKNYQILAVCDALVSDYSSVYYDYLLCDKPIGLCWEDFDEYNKREGFTVDPKFIMKGGEKIYTTDDFCAFIERIAAGEDPQKKERNEIKDLCHLHIDNGSTKRVVDYIEEIYL